MGLFDVFNRKNKDNDLEAILIGYLRTQTSKHLGHPVDSYEYEKACQAAGERVELVLLPMLDKATQQQVMETLSSHCRARVNEAFGEYLVLLWVRYCKIQIAISEGKVKPEEATTKILSDALHHQIKRVVAGASSR